MATISEAKIALQFGAGLNKEFQRGSDSRQTLSNLKLALESALFSETGQHLDALPDSQQLMPLAQETYEKLLEYIVES